MDSTGDSNQTMSPCQTRGVPFKLQAMTPAPLMAAGWSGMMKNLGVWLAAEVGPSEEVAAWRPAWARWVVPGFWEGPAGAPLGDRGQDSSSLSSPRLCSDTGVVAVDKCVAVLNTWDLLSVAGASVSVRGVCDAVDLTADGVTGVVSLSERTECPEDPGVVAMCVERGPVCAWGARGGADECADGKCGTGVAATVGSWRRKSAKVGPCELALSPVAAAFWATSPNVTAGLGVEEAGLIQSDTRETEAELLGVVGVESLLVRVNGDVK